MIHGGHLFTCIVFAFAFGLLLGTWLNSPKHRQSKPQGKPSQGGSGTKPPPPKWREFIPGIHKVEHHGNVVSLPFNSGGVGSCFVCADEDAAEFAANRIERLLEDAYIRAKS